MPDNPTRDKDQDMIAVATTDTTTFTAYRWEAGTLVAAQPRQRVGAARGHAPSAGHAAAATTSVSPSDLPTLVFLADS
ncbi:hypothetical protein GCM10009810_12920 [Nostocoides vanveenii]|uniref:Uncharacterized protein n=2 Tax=Nostocoides vanveenii TaxID=330835 RepID=A0ABN2KH88_9MICO